MSAVLPLQTTSVICIVRHLLDINDKHLRYRKPAEHLKRCILDNSCNVTALELLLQYMTKHYPGAVTDQMLEFLVPLHLKTFDLSKCTAALQLEGQYTSLLPRLSSVKSLIHTEGLLTDPLPLSVAFEWASKLPHLTSVILEECPGVTDKFVSIILFNVPKITHFNLARCSQITDAAFLNTSGQSPPKLTSLDISGCDSLTSTAIRLLTELCGPSLRHLNVACNNMDCTILWYLAGHSLASSVRLASEVRGKVNNLADAISSQMDRLIHEFQFITEKLKEMGARNGNNEPSSQDPGGVDKMADSEESEEHGGSNNNSEIKDETQGEADQACEETNHEDTSSRSHPTQASISEKQYAEAIAPDPPSVDAETKASNWLHHDGMNEYLEQQNAATASASGEKGDHKDRKSFKENGSDRGIENKLVADTRTHLDPSSEGDSSVVTPVMSHGNKGEAMNTAVAEGDSSFVTPVFMSHPNKGEAMKTEAATSQSSRVGQVADKSSNQETAGHGLEDPLNMLGLHHKDEGVHSGSHSAVADTTGASADQETIGDSSCVVEIVKGENTDLVGTQDAGGHSKEPSVEEDQSPSKEDQSELEEADKNTEGENEDAVKDDPCRHCLHNSSKAHVPTKLFQPRILSLKMDHIEFHADLIKSCFDEFFSANPCLQTVTIANRTMTNELLEVVADNCPDLKSLRLLDCAQISSQGLAYLLERCKQLKSLYLQGVPFLSNSAFCPLLDSEAALQTLHIAEVRITDGILHRLSKVIGHSLKELNLNWCEDITSQGILSMAENCPILETFSVRQFQVNEGTLRSLSVNCPKMKHLDLSGVEEMTDSLMAEMMPGFRMLQVLDFSWTLNLTDEAVKAILSSCPLLRDLNLAGLKRITEKPFLPIISDVSRWKRCQSLIKLKLREQKVRESTGQDLMSSDEEYEDLYVPIRSTSYAPLLQRMDLQFCDLVKDSVLEEIVAICCGSLEIIDYYGLEVRPKLLKL